MNGTINSFEFVGVCILGILLLIACLPWVVGCLPESLQANNGYGSSYCFDRVFRYFCIYKDNETFFRNHLTPDFLAGSWIFATLASSGVVIFPFVYPLRGPTYKCYYASVIILSIGAWVLLYGSYPKNIGSTVIYEAIFCDRVPESLKPTISYGTLAYYKTKSVIDRCEPQCEPNCNLIGC